MRVDTHIVDSVSCYCTNARRAARALTSLYDDAMAQHELKVTQFSLLRAVERHGEPSLSELATATGLDRSTLGRNLRLLEQLGLVALSPGVDQRDRRAALTQKGQARIRVAAHAWSAVQDRVGEILGKDAQQFVQLARRLTDLLGGDAQ
jgi:DNA-binding MarR family transcriptional regulator